MVANIGDSGHSGQLGWCPQYVPKISISGSMQGDSGDEASSGGRFAYCMADIKTRVPEDAEYLARRLESLIFRATKRVITLTPTYTDALDEDESGVVHSTGDVDVAVYYNNLFPIFRTTPDTSAGCSGLILNAGPNMLRLRPLPV